MSSLALSGLASGVDTSSIVQQLMAVDQQQVTALQNKQSTITGHQAALKNITTKLAALQTAANALTDSTAWKSSQTVTSSDSSKVATITALVRGPNNQFLSGVPVSFTADSGGLSVTQGTTDANGAATARSCRIIGRNPGLQAGRRR